MLVFTVGGLHLVTVNARGTKVTSERILATRSHRERLFLTSLALCLVGVNNTHTMASVLVNALEDGDRWSFCIAQR